MTKLACRRLKSTLSNKLSTEDGVHLSRSTVLDAPGSRSNKYSVRAGRCHEKMEMGM